MERADVDLAVEWATREGWNPGLADAAAFHAADPEGFLVSENPTGEPVACISAVRQGEGLGFVGFYIVAPERRGEGLGIAIWRAGMARLEGRLVGLDGVVDQQDAYARSGFRLAWRNLRYGADVPRPVDVPDGAVAVVEAAALPFPALAAYDAAHAAGPRESFLRPWLTLPGHVALAAVRDDVPAGLGVVRPSRAGAKIGPLFADARRPPARCSPRSRRGRPPARSSSTSPSRTRRPPRSRARRGWRRCSRPRGCTPARRRRSRSGACSGSRASSSADAVSRRRRPPRLRHARRRGPGR